jgi:cytoskeletal protein CcmA (bactofilin family)
MAYIGQEPLNTFSPVPSKDSFTGDGSTTAFDLQNSVVNGGENALEVFIDNVRQEPGSGKAFTLGVDGSNEIKRITFTAAPANGAAIYVINDKTSNVSTISPKDLNGVELILDADADTSITADTDDRIDFKIANTDHISIGTSSGDTTIKSATDAKDILFQQFDGRTLLDINDGGYVAISNGDAGSGQLRIYEDSDNGTNYSAFQVGSQSADITYTLPTADGTSGFQLTTNGSGVLSWAAAQIALANDGNNRIVTGTGSAGLNAEANLTFDGSTLTNAGATQLNSTLTVGANDQGYDIIIYGDTASANLTWDTSVDDLIFNGAARIVIPDGQLVLGSTAVTSTAAELNLVDGITAGTVIASKAIITDSNKDITGGRNITISGELDAGSLDVSGDVDVDGSLETDALTIGGTTLAEVISDTTGAMFSSNTETGITVTYQDGDNTIDLALAAAQTTITSLLATDIKIGEDDQTKIDFETADEIHFYAANAEQVFVSDGVFGPQTDSDVDLGTTGVRFKDAFIDTITTTGAITSGAGLVIADSGNIGSASDTDAIAIASNGQVTLTQTLIGTALDISGDIDVDGTTNLDIVDIDGAVDMATTLGVAGVVTANAGVVIDNITIDGTEIDLSSGDLTLDVAGDIILDAGGNNWSFQSGSTEVLNIANSSSDVIIKPVVDAKDLIFQQRDGTEVFRVEDGAYMSLAAMSVNPEATLTDASTVTWNSLTSPVAKVTLGGNRTIAAATGAVAGTFASLLVIQDGTGSRTVTWNAAYEFAADTAPTLTTTANLGDLFVFRYNGAKWLETGRNLALTLS